MKDLSTVMVLQRRLNSIQRDVGPLEDKVCSRLTRTQASKLKIKSGRFWRLRTRNLVANSQVLVAI